ncbi:MAG: hypothetical protein ACE5HS_04920 [bacterium]
MSRNTFNILFVCSGNSCRSPIAEGLLRIKIPPHLRDRVSVASAGTLGLYGNPATFFAIKVANDLGADIANHQSQGVTEDLLQDMDIIFAMAVEHQDYLQKNFTEFRENVFLLKAFARPTSDNFHESIEDPIGGSLAVYQECARIIDEELDRILPRLIQLSEEKLKSE